MGPIDVPIQRLLFLAQFMLFLRRKLTTTFARRLNCPHDAHRVTYLTKTSRIIRNVRVPRTHSCQKSNH